MSKSTSKLERMLATHDLDSLCYGKRDRKFTTQAPSIQQNPEKKKLIKKKPRPTYPVKLKQTKQKHQVKQTNKEQKKRIKKVALKQKKQKVRVKVESSKVKKDSLKKVQQMQQKQIQMIQSQGEIQVIDEQRNFKKQEQIKNKQVSVHVSEQQCSEIVQQQRNLSKIDKQKKQIDQKHQPPKSQKRIIKEQINCFKQNQFKNQQQNINNSNNIQEQSSESQQNVVQKQQKNNKRFNLRNRVPKLPQSNQIQQQDIQISQEHSLRKRKAISNAHYSLNRIFRKTSKNKVPSHTIQANLQQISILGLVKDMHQFDMIHCSLPLQLLIQLPQIGQIIKKGFIFIWAEKGEIPLGYHLLNRWGFDVIDQIMWIKTDKHNYSVTETFSQTDLFINCRSTCLVGYKCPVGEKVDYCTKISNNLIFAVQNLNYKPNQIYQIAQLIMPGSRRLQIGSDILQQCGWFILKHIQKSVNRCHKCFRTDRQLSIVKVQDQKQIVCNECTIKLNKIETQCEEQLVEKEDKCIKYNTIKTKIIDKTIEVVNCSNCKQKFNSEGYIHCNCEGHEYQCFNCFDPQKHKNHQISTIKQKKKYYNFKSAKCTQCEKTILKILYFQCTSCKEHNLCTECFWNKSKSIDDKKHDWKMRPIHNSIDFKIMCFSCEQQCFIPYWCCQTCQNWYWCGNCTQKCQMDSIHSHTKFHNLALII